MNIGIIGFGYVGQAIAASALDFSDGHKVWVIDTDPEINSEAIREVAVRCRRSGLSVEEHPNREEFRLFELAISSKRLFFWNDYEHLNFEDIDVFFICVPDVNVIEALGNLRKHLRKGSFVSIESTIDFHLYNKICGEFANPQTDDDGEVEFPFILVVSPERIMEGQLMEKFRCEVKVIGATKVEDYISATNVFMMIGVPQMEYCTPREAIMVKMAELGFRYTTIAFAHAVSDICHYNGCDFERVRELVNTCSSVDNFAYSGIGIGGKCLPEAMEKLKKYDNLGTIVDSLIRVEEWRSDLIIRWVYGMISWVTGSRAVVKDPSYSNVLFLGTTYRPEGASVKDSPAVELIRRVGEQVKKAWVWDPLMEEVPKEFFDHHGDLAIEVVGRDGLENLNVDVIVLVMPHMDILHKLEELLEKWPNVAVINLTHDTIPTKESHKVAHRRW